MREGVKEKEEKGEGEAGRGGEEIWGSRWGKGRRVDSEKETALSNEERYRKKRRKKGRILRRTRRSLVGIRYVK